MLSYLLIPESKKTLGAVDSGSIRSLNLKALK